MFLRCLALADFRNYRSLAVEFAPGVNLFWGANAQGKSSLLEAVYFLITGRSFRTQRLKDLVRDGATTFCIEALFSKQGVDHQIQVRSDGSRHRILLNQTSCPALSSLLGRLQGVIHTAEDAALIRGAPALRRRYLYLQLAQADPVYLRALARYHRALKQRNLLLKTGDRLDLENWNQPLAEAAALIALRHHSLVAALNELSPRVQDVLSANQDQLELSYKSEAVAHTDPELLAHRYLEALQKNVHRELAFGSTLIGPHRDDLTILLQTREARYFASEGQQRSCAAALRLAEWHRLRDATGETPLMLIDDMGLGLDPYRRQQFEQQLESLGQVFVTSPVESLSGKTFEIKAAQISSSQKRSAST